MQGDDTLDFITAEEKTTLQQRVKDLEDRRPTISGRIAEARADGDLKENADYHAARDEQGMNEAEIRRLTERLANAQVAGDDEIPQGVVFMGSVVRLRDDDDDSDDLYKIVGEATGSFDSDEIEVTANSPMGESLMKARVGETIKVDLPRGIKRFEIVEIL